MAHFPCEHRDPSELAGDDGQDVPQAPQFCVSVFKSTQVLSHKVSVLFEQAGPHRPFRHFSWLLQERPQTPQFFVSVRIFTQELLQMSWPAEQESSGVIVTPAVAVETGVSSGGRHVPLWQICPFGQSHPHFPQLSLSARRSAHFPLQRFWPEGHGHLEGSGVGLAVGDGRGRVVTVGESEVNSPFLQTIP